MFTSQPKVSFPDRLYSSGIADYLEIIKTEETASSIMIIGHNPTCGGLVASLYGSGGRKTVCSNRDEVSDRNPCRSGF